MDPSIPTKRLPVAVRNLPLVCKKWYGPATTVLYEIIEFPRVASVFQFHRTLQDRPHLRKLVKSLLLPGRIGHPCPDNLMKVFVQIINLVDSLVNLYTTCRLMNDYRFEMEYTSAGNRCVLPLEPGKHDELCSLDLYADTAVWSTFPSMIPSAFSQLECLSLHGFFLLYPVSPATTPPLPKLKTLYFSYGRGVTLMDEWLQTCPEFSILLLRETDLPNESAILDPDQQVAPLAALREGKITHLRLDCMCGPSRIDACDWIGQCTGIQDLQITWDVFTRHAEVLTFPMERLTLCIDTIDNPCLETFERFLAYQRIATPTAPTVKTFEVVVCKHNRWYADHQVRLMEMFQEAGIAYEYDCLVCLCQSECHLSNFPTRSIDFCPF
jgi:hypothetical protein